MATYIAPLWMSFSVKLFCTTEDYPPPFFFLFHHHVFFFIKFSLGLRRTLFPLLANFFSFGATSAVETFVVLVSK